MFVVETGEGAELSPNHGLAVLVAMSWAGIQTRLLLLDIER